MLDISKRWAWAASRIALTFSLALLVYLLTAAKGFEKIGWRYYLIFIIVPAFCVVCLYVFYPETAGLPLEEIGRLFGDETFAEVDNGTNAHNLSGDKEKSVPDTKG